MKIQQELISRPHHVTGIKSESEKLIEQIELARLTEHMKEKEAELARLQQELKVAQNRIDEYKKAEKAQKDAEEAERTRLAEELAKSEPQIPRETYVLIVVN